MTIQQSFGSQHCDVLLLGDYFFDIIYSGLPEFPVLGREIYSDSIITTGGAMFITATALRRLGVNVGWAGHFGDDSYSHFVMELAERERISLNWARRLSQPYRCITTSLPMHGERAFVTYTDPEPVDWFDYWLNVARTASYKHLHVGSLLCIEKAEPLFKAARERGATISMDCQDVELLHTNGDWKTLLGLVDVFLPNAREAKILTKTDDVRDALAILRQWVRLAVIKDGANGAWIGSGSFTFNVPCITVSPVVDTTGAGDCFNAGFIYGYILQGVGEETAARYGNICGGLSVTGIGGATNAPTLDQLFARL